MSDFETAIAVILAHEGGVSDHPADHGGHTRYGVTWPFYHDAHPDGTKEQFAALTLLQAEECYRIALWDRWHMDLIRDQRVATKLLDMMVNLGVRAAVRIAQNALTLLGYPTTPDGILGRATRTAVNDAVPTLLLGELKRGQRRYYESIVAAHPDQAVFLRGWLRRASWPDEVAT